MDALFWPAAVQAGSSGLQSVFIGVPLVAKVYKKISDSRSNVPERVIKQGAPNIECFETLNKPLENILNFLKGGKNVQGILIHGALGAGKTTIMQNVNNHKEVADLFEIIIWLKVSSDNLDSNGSKENFSIQELRKDVMQRLKLDTKIEASECKNAIYEKLKKTKYLLLLDNVKDAIDLNEIGFPENRVETGSKIVLTSRFRLVWTEIVDQYIEVKLLTETEAERMFTNILNGNINEDYTNYKVQALKWCHHLPFAIKHVAAHCRSATDEDSWKSIVNSLKTRPKHGDNITKQMCRQMSFCCDCLSEHDKHYFYYGALYPEGSNIYKDRLLDCWMADKFLKSRGDYEQRILERLKDLHLFEEDERKVCVTMHKLIRLVALHKLETDIEHKGLVLCNKEPFDQQNCWGKMHWISLVDNNNWKPSPDSTDGSVLSTLFLQGNSTFKKLPDMFFEKMGSLCVVDLMGTSIESLPYSLMNSKTLKVLYLNECSKLKNLPSEIGNLELLEVLDISGTGIKEVPTEIQALKHLKRFLVSSSALIGTDNIFHVISGLTELEEMLIDIKSDEESFDWKIVNVVINSVKPLNHMTSLQFRSLNDELVVVWKVEDGIRKFVVYPILSEAVEMHVLVESYVANWTGREPSLTAVGVLLMSDAVEIIVGEDLKHLDTINFLKMAAILVEDCKEITYIFGPSSMPLRLEQLYLTHMGNLESVTGGPFNLRYFGKLTILKLYSCPLLTNIITKDAKEEDISTSAVQKKGVVFPKLEELVLVDLPKLVSIWKNELLEFPSLIEVEIRNCPALKYLPISPNNTQKLKSIKTTTTWWGALRWKDAAAKTYFQPFLVYDD